MKNKLPILVLASVGLASCGTSTNNALAALNNGEGTDASEARVSITVDEARLVAWDIVARQDTLDVLNAYKDYKVSLSETEYDEEGVATSYSYEDISSEKYGYFAYDYGEEGKDYVASVDDVSYYITSGDGSYIGYSNEKFVKRATRELSDYISEPIDIAMHVLEKFKADSLPEEDPVTEEVTALARVAEADVSTSESSTSESSTSEGTSSEEGSSSEGSSETVPPSTSEDTSSSETPVEPEISESLLAYSEGEGDLLLSYAYSRTFEEKTLAVSASIDIKEDLLAGLDLSIDGVYSASYVITYGTSEEERTVPEFTISETSIEDEHDHHEDPWCPEGGDHGHGENGSELETPPSDDHGWGKGDHGNGEDVPQEPSVPEGDSSSSSGDTSSEEVPGDGWGHGDGHPGGWH